MLTESSKGNFNLKSCFILNDTIRAKQIKKPIYQIIIGFLVPGRIDLNQIGILSNSIELNQNDANLTESKSIKSLIF